MSTHAMRMLWLLAAAACSDPMGRTPDPPDDPEPPAATSLVIQAPASMLVHERALITVTARDSAGQTVPLPASLTLTTTDFDVAVLNGQVIEGLRRGRATIVATSGTLVDSLSIPIRARVMIRGPAYLRPDNDIWTMAVGDTLQFTAFYVDINGLPTGEDAAATWTSTDASVVAVDSLGRTMPLQPSLGVSISAQTPEGVARALVSVLNVVAGAPATVRFAHTAPTLGPLTFIPNKGNPFTLSFGDVLERNVGSGSFYVEIQGLHRDPLWRPSDDYFLIREGEYLSLYAIGDPNLGGLARAYAPGTQPVGPDSGLVRLVQGSRNGAQVVYLREHGAAMSGLPEQCYFDPTSVSIFYSREAGTLDVILQEKYGAMAEMARFPATLAAGQAMTLILVGETPETWELLTFPEP